MSINIPLRRNANRGNRLNGKYPNGNEPATIDPTTLPRATWPTNFTFEGAFRLPDGNLSGGRSIAGNNTNLAMGLSNTAGRLFVSGKQTMNQDQGITEITIPTLVNSLTLGDLNTAVQTQDVRQPFSATTQGNSDANDIIGGVYVHNGKLILTCGKIYDGAADNTQFILTLDNPSDIVNSTVSGFYDVQGRFKASAGWISEVPTEWQPLVGASHVMGNSSRYSIAERSSKGPSCYVFNPSDITGTVVDPVPTTTLLSYSSSPGENIQEQIDPTWNLWNTTDGLKYNEGTGISQGNDCWTNVTAANFGFIIPGTRTYACFGGSGGHTSCVGYKFNQSNGYLTPGNGAYDPQDYQPYYWFFDMNDLIDVKNGVIQSYEVVPYEYGPITGMPYEHSTNNDGKPRKFLNGVYDAVNNRMYIGAGMADGSNGNLPVVLAYSIGGL